MRSPLVEAPTNIKAHAFLFLLHIIFSLVLLWHFATLMNWITKTVRGGKKKKVMPSTFIVFAVLLRCTFHIFCENYSEMRKRENEEEYFDRVRLDAGKAGIVDGVKDRGDLMVGGVFGFLKVWSLWLGKVKVETCWKCEVEERLKGRVAECSEAGI
jgi:hypothetical protein